MFVNSWATVVIELEAVFVNSWATVVIELEGVCK